MVKEIKEKWVKALRSGEYKQGRLQLVDISDPEVKEYCCLGVLTDLYMKEKPKSRKWGKQARYTDAALSAPVRRWAGLTDGDPEVKKQSLSKHNDGNGILHVKRKTFKVIASLIEKEL